MRSRWQQGASPSSAKERAPSSVTGGLEETHRTLRLPCWKETWMGWDGHRLSQAGSALPGHKGLYWFLHSLVYITASYSSISLSD